MSSKYTLYGSEFSLYTGKLRSYLRKKGIDYQEVLATAAVYKQFVIPRTGVRYVPVLQTPEDEVLQDTTVIIDALEQRFSDRSVYPSSPKQRLVSLLLELYGDEWLVIPAMHYRWNFPAQNDEFIYAEFGGMIMPKAPAFIRRYLGKKVGSKFKGFVPGLGITEQTINAIEHSYVQFLKDLDTHFQEHDYLLGGRPCIADFGFMGPLYAHLNRDPAPAKLMRKIAPNVCAWVRRMNSLDSPLQSSSDMGDLVANDLPANDLPANKIVVKDFVANDEIPVTLIPILKRMATEQAPVLIDTNRLLDEWRKANPEASEVPRSIGKHEFKIGDSRAARMIIPYSLWMLQRSVDFYQASEHQTDLDSLLDSVGLTKLLNQDLNNRIHRPNNVMAFA